MIFWKEYSFKSLAWSSYFLWIMINIIIKSDPELKHSAPALAKSFSSLQLWLYNTEFRRFKTHIPLEDNLFPPSRYTPKLTPHKPCFAFWAPFCLYFTLLTSISPSSFISPYFLSLFPHFLFPLFIFFPKWHRLICSPLGEGRDFPIQTLKFLHGRFRIPLTEGEDPIPYTPSVYKYYNP